MTLRVSIPWDCLASSNERNSRRGGAAHSWGYKQAREAIHLHAMNQVRGDRPRIPDNRVRVRLGFHAPDFRRRDEANYLKVILDALQGVVYADDWQIKDLSYLRCDPDAENPRVEVTVEEVRQG